MLCDMLWIHAACVSPYMCNNTAIHKADPYDLCIGLSMSHWATITNKPVINFFALGHI